MSTSGCPNTYLLQMLKKSMFFEKKILPSQQALCLGPLHKKKSKKVHFSLWDKQCTFPKLHFFHILANYKLRPDHLFFQHIHNDRKHCSRVKKGILMQHSSTLKSFKILQNSGKYSILVLISGNVKRLQYFSIF